MKALALGLRHQWEVVPDQRDTAAAIGNSGVHVVSTPRLIALLEQTCHLVIDASYDAGEASVGTRVEVDHLAAAYPGRSLQLSAELIAQDGRRLSFQVEARQGDRAIMRGRHDRHVIDLARFSAARSGPADRARGAIDFWFDFNSPWCCLAALRIGGIARRRERSVAWRPVHLARLIERIDGRRSLDENPAFVRWYRQDLRDWAELQGIALNYPPGFPRRPSRALRAALHAADEGRAEGFVTAVMRDYWTAGKDIGDPAVLQAAGRDSGLDPSRIEQVIADPRYKERLTANLDEAVEQGLFGVPAVLAEGKLFFGNDRLALLEDWLDRREADEAV